MLDEYYAVETNFRKQSFPDYYTILYGFADALDSNEHFNVQKPGCVPDGPKFRQHVTTMKELGIGADRGDSLLKDQRQTVRDLSELDMDASMSFMRILAIEKKDPSMLHTMGLPLKENHQKNSRRTLSPQMVEIRVTLKHLKGVSGAIVIEGNHVRNGGPYLINLCKGEVVSESAWYNPGGHYKTCSRITIKNLEPANRYYVRMRNDGPDGPGPWSQAVSIIVL
jgi:hypothetical protein